MRATYRVAFIAGCGVRTRRTVSNAAVGRRHMALLPRLELEVEQGVHQGGLVPGRRTMNHSVNVFVKVLWMENSRMNSRVR